jgi:hypothetical protein
MGRWQVAEIEGRGNEAPAAAPTDLTAFAAGRARFIGRPFMRRSLFVRRTTPFAGDFALLLW